MNQMGRLLVLIVLLFLLVIRPLIYLADAHSGVTETRIKDISYHFINDIREKEMLTEEEFESFLLQLSASGEHYEVELELARKRTISSELAGNAANHSKLANNEVYHSKLADNEAYHSKLVGNSAYYSKLVSLLKQEDESKIRPLSAQTHLHTDACYRGIKHVHTGRSGSCYEEREEETGCGSCGGDGEEYVYTNWVPPYDRPIDTDGDGIWDDREFGGGYWEGEYRTCGPCGGSGSVREKRRVLVCRKKEGAYYNGEVLDAVPSCHQVVTRTGAKYNYQEVKQNDEITALEDTLVATYLDGTTAEIKAASITGFDSDVPGSYIVTLNYKGLLHDAKTTGTLSNDILVQVVPITTFCEHDHEYLLSNTGEDMGCPICRETLVEIAASKQFLSCELGEMPELLVEVIATYLDNHTEYVTGWTSNYNSNLLGIQTVTIAYQGMTTSLQVKQVKNYICLDCNTEYPSDLDGTDGGCPRCNNSVLGLRVDVRKDRYLPGEKLEIEVYAIYKEREEIVENWTTNYSPYIRGEQLVSIFYENYSYEFTIHVVSQELVTCPICGESYHQTEFGWCTSCRDTITEIHINKENSEHVVYKGTTPFLTLTILYRDGYRRDITSGYRIMNFRAYTEGIQNIVLEYQGFFVTHLLQVIDKERAKLICKDGHRYEANPNGSDPGCPYCNEQEVPEILSYVDIMYSEQFLEQLYGEGSVQFEKGDYVILRVKKTTQSFVARLRRLLSISDKKEEEEHFVYGGEVF